MYERMLNKNTIPSYEEMCLFCDQEANDFDEFNTYLNKTFETVPTITFPYGNSYGWAVAHRIKKKLICCVFPQAGAFNVMLRLTNKQFNLVYEKVGPYAKTLIDNKYPCSDGGWIHYCVSNATLKEDIYILLKEKLSKGEK